MGYITGTGRKKAAKDRGDLANKLAALEGGKSQARVGDIRQILKLLVKFDADATYNNKKSAIIALRREAAAKAKSMK